MGSPCKGGHCSEDKTAQPPGIPNLLLNLSLNQFVLWIDNVSSNMIDAISNSSSTSPGQNTE